MNTTPLPEYKARWIKEGAYKYAIDTTSSSRRIFCATLKEVAQELKRLSKYSTVKIFRQRKDKDVNSLDPNKLFLLEDLTHNSGATIGYGDYFINNSDCLLAPEKFLYEKIKVPQKYLLTIECRVV